MQSIFRNPALAEVRTIRVLSLVIYLKHVYSKQQTVIALVSVQQHYQTRILSLKINKY